MTIEARIPLDDVKKALAWYDTLYRKVTNPKRTYLYKMQMARNTILSLVFSLVKIALFVGCIVWAVNAHEGIQFIPVILAIILGVSIFLDLFYIDKVPDKKLPRLRFRPIHFITSVLKDLYEFSVFKKYFGVSTPAFLLMLGFGEKEALEHVEDWGYFRAQKQLDNINNYKKKYSAYRDYIDLDQHWHIARDLLNLINSGRATDIASALDAYDVKQSRERIERMAQNEAERAMLAADRVASAAKEVEEAAKAEQAAAKEVEELARSARNQS